mmetsp:Transcript_63867/g.101221  ORF Transcript_63867/g.101221 Transcript_63867/m.101221 type:complete len:118 (+) Transcript_63867:74-427(+)
MLTTTLRRTALRCGVRTNKVLPPSPQSAVVAASVGSIRTLAMSSVRLGGDYDWNMGTPGSRIRNPAPHLYNDVYPDMGWQWWAYIGTAIATFFYGHTYDSTRPVKIDIGIFGPNMPL